MIGRVRWAAVGAVLLASLAILAAMMEERDLVIALGLAAITLAILSLNESQ